MTYREALPGIPYHLATEFMEGWPPEVLSEQVLAEQGCYQLVKRHLRGQWPELGTLVIPDNSWSGGWETIIIQDIIKPLGDFEVI